MKSFEFKLKTITPLIMSGADQEEFELREMSIVGAMRYWYRKLYGSNEETEIFGSTGRKGRFRIYISEVESNNEQNSDGCFDNYFFLYPPKLREEVKKRSFMGTFKIEMQIYNGAYEEKLLNSIVAMIFIGGIGTRSRRGYGSLEIISSSSYSNSFISPFEHKNLDSIQRIYGRLKELARKNGYELSVLMADTSNGREFSEKFNSESKKENRYSRFTPLNLSNITGNRDNCIALKIAGEILRSYRSRMEPDYSFIKEYLNNKKEEIIREIKRGKYRKKYPINVGKIERTAFGAPLLFRSSSFLNRIKRELNLNKKINITISAEKINGFPDSIRIPSPLFIRILKIENNCKPFFIFYIPENLDERSKRVLKTFEKVLINAGAKKVIP